MSDNLPGLEFQSPDDDAWYDVEVWRMFDAMVLSYTDLPYDQDEMFLAYDFKSIKELERFEKRFRVVSPQMQDEQCSIVGIGTLLCATLPSVTGDVKYYDAVVVGKEEKEHDRDEDGGDICNCIFKVFWIDGPSKNQFTFAKVGDICLKQEDDRVHPTVVSFVNEVKSMINGGASSSSHQGGETERQKTIRKVKLAVRNYNANSSFPETQD